MTTIAAQVAQMRASRPPRPEGAPPSPAQAEQARLVAAGVPDGVLAAGSKLADIDVLDVDGKPTTLFAALGDTTAVVVLYRGEWCPFCSITLRTYQSELVPTLDELDVHLVALSPQHPDGALSMKEKHDLTFSVLSDPGNQLARQLGVQTAPSPEHLEDQLSRGFNLAERNVDGTIDLPMPTVLIADADHVLRWIDVHPDYTTRSEPAEILAALHAL